MGQEGKGFTEVMQGFDFSRILIALQCVAAAQASIDETWEYVKERQAMGAPLAQYQGVSFPIVEFETLIAACRQLCYHGLALRDAGQPHTAESAMVKWMGPKTSFDAIHQCILTFGHYGWSKDLPHQQRLRDVMGERSEAWLDSPRGLAADRFVSAIEGVVAEDFDFDEPQELEAPEDPADALNEIADEPDTDD